MQQQVTTNNDTRPKWLTLGKATSYAPGRPSANCLWRWCRKGVLARDGSRVKLQHVRAGGRVFTTAAWVEEFATALAHADAAYFDTKHVKTPSAATVDSQTSKGKRDWSDPAERAAAEAVLREEGI